VVNYCGKKFITLATGVNIFEFFPSSLMKTPEYVFLTSLSRLVRDFRVGLDPTQVVHLSYPVE
jgi:hypothetical protein